MSLVKTPGNNGFQQKIHKSRFTRSRTKYHLCTAKQKVATHAFRGNKSIAEPTSRPISPIISPSPSPPAFPWLPIAFVFLLTISSLAGTFIVTVIYLRPIIQAAERAAIAAEIAAKEMKEAAEEMEKTALMMQVDIPVTMLDIQEASQEFELLGKQLNYLAETLIKPVVQPVEALGAAATATSERASGLTQRVVSDSSALANILRSTLSSFRRQMGWTSLSIAQREEASRRLSLTRRQQEARLWIARWRDKKGSKDGRSDNGSNSNSSSDIDRNERKAAPSSIRGAEDSNEEGIAAMMMMRPPAPIALQQSSLIPSRVQFDLSGVAEMGRLLRDSLMSNTGGNRDGEDAAAAVLTALERAQLAAEEAARASGVLEEAIQRAEKRGVWGGSSSDEDD